MQIRFTLRRIQYMATSALQSEHFTFGVRKCYIGRNLYHIYRPTEVHQSFFSGMDSSQHRLFCIGHSEVC